MLWANSHLVKWTLLRISPMRDETIQPIVLALDIGTSSTRALLFDHRGRAVPQPMAVLNVLSVIDCFDASGSTFDQLSDGTLISLRKISIREDQVPDAVAAFRVLRKTSMIVVRRDLAERITLGNFSGLELVSMPGAVDIP